MTDHNIPTVPHADARPSRDAFDAAWEFARNEMPDVSRVGMSGKAVEVLEEWINGRAGRPCPDELLDGTYSQVLIPTATAYLYVRDDPSQQHAKSEFYCMRSGRATIYRTGDGSVFYKPSPCESFTHDGCGPRRCFRIFMRMTDVWSEIDEVFLLRVDAPTLEQLAARIGTVETERGLAASAVQRAGGSQLTIINGVPGDYHAHIFADVDFSARKYKDRPERLCDRLPTEHALDYLDQLLRGGIIERAASRSIGLTDSSWYGRGEASGGISLGMVSEKQRNRIRPAMRRLYIESGGTAWPADNMGWPPEWEDADRRSFGNSAVEQIRAEDKVRAEAARAERQAGEPDESM